MPSSYALNLGLNDIPDEKLDPEVWNELNKVFMAAKLLAQGLETGANQKLAGTPGSRIKIQNYCRVLVTPSFDVSEGQVLEITNLGVRLAGNTYRYPGVYAEFDIPANTPGLFTFIGAVYYPAGGLIPGTNYHVDQTQNNGSITTNTTGKYVGTALSANSLFFNPKVW